MKVTQFNFDTRTDDLVAEGRHLSIKAEACGVVVRVGTTLRGTREVVTVSVDPIGRDNANQLDIQEIAAHGLQARLVVASKDDR